MTDNKIEDITNLSVFLTLVCSALVIWVAVLREKLKQRRLNQSFEEARKNQD